MIRITVYKENQDYIGFNSMGHAGYAKDGYDIICAAVSALTVNAINSIEAFTSDKFQVEQRDGYIEFRFAGKASKESQLLLKSMVLGLQEIEKDYGNAYIHMIFKEV